jgi:hypothetical protein
MTAPKCCPVCGQESIQPVVRTAIVKIQEEEHPITGALAYPCTKGHLFLLGSAEPETQAD